MTTNTTLPLVVIVKWESCAVCLIKKRKDMTWNQNVGISAVQATPPSTQNTKGRRQSSWGPIIAALIFVIAIIGLAIIWSNHGTPWSNCRGYKEIAGIDKSLSVKKQIACLEQTDVTYGMYSFFNLLFTHLLLLSLLFLIISGCIALCMRIRKKSHSPFAERTLNQNLARFFGSIPMGIITLFIGIRSAVDFSPHATCLGNPWNPKITSPKNNYKFFASCLPKASYTKPIAYQGIQFFFVLLACAGAIMTAYGVVRLYKKHHATAAVQTVNQTQAQANDNSQTPNSASSLQSANQQIVNGAQQSQEAQSSTADAGWYQSPDGTLRYWDGTKWLNIPAPAGAQKTIQHTHHAARKNNALTWIQRLFLPFDATPAGFSGEKKAAVWSISSIVVLALIVSTTAIRIGATQPHISAEMKSARSGVEAVEAAERAEEAREEKEKEEKAAEELKKTVRQYEVKQLEDAIKKMADQDVSDGVLDGPILSTQCSPANGSSEDDDTSTEYSCIAVTKKNNDGTVSGYAFHGLINWDSGEMTYGLGRN